jgi:hypothetical protein
MEERPEFQNPHHAAFVNRFVQACQSDDRVVAACLIGSIVKGTADPYSDVDLSVITTDSSFKDFYDRRESFLRSLGELAFLENFGSPNIAFYIFADGVEGELIFGREGSLEQIHSGPFRVLVDKKNILTSVPVSEPVPDASEQLEKLRLSIFGFWHECSHFIAAMGRGQLWWARGQLAAMRSISVNLARLQHNFLDEEAGEEPYFKIDNAMPVQKLETLRGTFCPMEKQAMLNSAKVILGFYEGIAPELAREHGIAYPVKLATLMKQRLDNLLL